MMTPISSRKLRAIVKQLLLQTVEIFSVIFRHFKILQSSQTAVLRELDVKTARHLPPFSICFRQFCTRTLLAGSDAATCILLMMSTLYEQYKGYTTERLIQALEADGDVGSPQRAFLESLLSIRIAEIVNAQLAATANAISTSAKDINSQISGLTTALSQASSDIQAAGAQSTSLGRSLNRLTAIIAIAALISAAATAYSACETGKQVALMQAQIAQPGGKPLPPSAPPSAR